MFFGCAPKVRPSRSYRKNQWNYDDFQSCITLPRDRSGARSVSKTCSKITFPKRELTLFIYLFFSFWHRRAAVQKNAAKMTPEALPESLQGSPGDPLGAQNRSTSRLRPARGARQVIFEISGGLPGSPGEGPGWPRSLQDPPGRLRGGS